MTDAVLNQLFFDIYRFLMHVRSAPNFDYDYDFWGTIKKHIIECMNYERFSDKSSKVLSYCQFGYSRYNEMFWFILNAQY